MNELPTGRKSVITEIVEPDHRAEIYEKVRLELKAGRQVYVICPLINDPDPDEADALRAKSVKAESVRLRKDVFPEYNIDILHSRMKTAEKEKVMLDFKAKKIQILCATSVIEVGVNVPNATNIIIEGAERFGLAQLHQLRGRVLRSDKQAYCYLFTDHKGEKTEKRLKAMITAKNGFELAELDMQERGIGTLSGNIQWGISDIAMEALKNKKMVEAARTEAENIIKTDSDLSKYPILKKSLESIEGLSHGE